MTASFLRIQGHPFPPLSLRQCRQTLSFVPQGMFRRTVDGKLLFVGGDAKFRTKIEGTDVHGVSLAILRPGMEVEVESLQPLWEEIPSSGVLRLMRRAVPESVVALAGKVTYQDQMVHAQKGGGLVSYRPLLDMRVIEAEVSCEEWKRRTTWSLILEEI